MRLPWLETIKCLNQQLLTNIGALWQKKFGIAKIGEKWIIIWVPPFFTQSFFSKMTKNGLK